MGDSGGTIVRMTDEESQLLRDLLQRQPVAALATLHKGAPAVSMVPFAVWPDAAGLVIHVSRLATHTQDMLTQPEVSLLVTGAMQEAETPLALPRVSVSGRARALLRDSDEHATARDVYLHKLPDAEPLFDFGDFSLFVIEPTSARFVVGFGRALSLTGERWRGLWADAGVR